jgi:hypothetical protein
MTDWIFADTQPSSDLALLHLFSVQKRQGDRSIEFRITVREYVKPNQLSMRFYADADKQVNQKTLPFTPFGWGQTLLEALSNCVQSIHNFPYEGD